MDEVVDLQKTVKPGERRSFAFGATIFAVALWVLFAGSFAKDELFVGFIVTILSVAFTLFMKDLEHVAAHLRWRDVAQGWRLPWYLLVDCWTILRVLVRDVFSKTPAGSFFRVFRFDHQECNVSVSGETTIGQIVLAVVYTTATPNSIVLGIHKEQLLLHQIARTPLEQTTRDLGARA